MQAVGSLVRSLNSMTELVTSEPDTGSGGATASAYIGYLFMCTNEKKGAICVNGGLKAILTKCTIQLSLPSAGKKT